MFDNAGYYVVCKAAVAIKSASSFKSCATVVF
jgi:hypothetical protein